MCHVSVIYDTFNKQADEWFTMPRIDLFVRMVLDAKILDKESGQPDCETPEKALVLERINKIKTQLEEEDDYRGADHE